MKAELHNSCKDLAPSNDLLLVLGDGRTMPDDLAKFLDWYIPADFGCIGRSIRNVPYAKHWFNADGETAIAWVKQIKQNAQNGLITHTLGEVDGFDCDWDIEQPDYHFEEITNQKGRTHGSSAMFATLAGLAMGYSKIVLAGCPMDAEGHWYFEPTKETLGPLWIGCDFMAWLDFAKQPGAHRVRSLSGYTADVLGIADRSWCCGM